MVFNIPIYPWAGLACLVIDDSCTTKRPNPRVCPLRGCWLPRPDMRPILGPDPGSGPNEVFEDDEVPEIDRVDLNRWGMGWGHKGGHGVFVFCWDDPGEGR